MTVGSILVAGILGGLAGALVSDLLREDAFEDRTVLADGRGQIVTFWRPWGDRDGVFCNELHHVCLSESDDGATVTAFYTYTTNSAFREQGCPVRWEPEYDLGGRLGRPGESGAFTSPCGGSVWDRDGVRLFGPAARDLDQFAVRIEPHEVPRAGSDIIRVDTRRLICGASAAVRVAAGCERAPRID